MLPHLETLAEMARAGAILELPLIGRKIPLLADRYADPEKGTGAVKITPAHDYNDYAVGERHKGIGPPINILNPDGTINDNGTGEFRGRKFSYTGLDRMEARGKVVEDLQDIGLFDREEDIENTIPLSDRSKTPIEPYLSDQWFVRMGDADGQPGLAQRAIDAVKDGRVRFFPERYGKTYLDWLSEKRDWCISRQLWWGHRIPIWYAYCPENELKRIFASREDVTWRLDADNGRWLICALEDLPSDILGPKYTLEQDADVLDTWFSSALWPHSTLGWPEQTAELAYWYPTSVLVTSRDIITLWVARMVMTGLYNLDKVPFHHVYIHPKILDGFGETMSKTKGNGIDPLDIIARYGTDALRFLMVHQATETQDSKMPVANVCPHCDALVPIKQEHMYMRTRKVTCPNCKKPFRPGGPWPAPDPELPTAKQAIGALRPGPQLRQQALERRPLPLPQPGRLPTRSDSTGRSADRGPLDFEPPGDDDGSGDAAPGELSFQRGGADDLRFHLVGVLRLVRRDEQAPPARSGIAASGAACPRWLARRHFASGAADHAVRGRVDLAGAERNRVRARPADAGAGRRERGPRVLAEPARNLAGCRDGDAHRPHARIDPHRPRGTQSLHNGHKIKS